MSRKLSKNARNLIILIVCFASLLIIQKIHLYGFQQTEIIELDSVYVDPLYNRTVTESFEINVIKPTSSASEKLPVCILLHGDVVYWQSMNLLKLEFLYNNYMVVLLNLDHQPEDYFKLNTTLDYILTRSDVNKSQIGIAGHSHGATFAAHFAAMRNESINAVVCGNFPWISMFYTDYLEYYLRYVYLNTSLDSYDLYNYMRDPENYEGYIPDDLVNFSLPFSYNKPRNLLLITNLFDYAHDEPLEQYVEFFTDEQYSQINQQHGDFQNGTARELYMSNPILLHASSLVDPESMNKITTWVNTAFGIDNSLNEYKYTELRVSIEIITLIGMLILGSLIILNICNYIPNQEEKLRDLKKKRKSLDDRKEKISEAIPDTSNIIEGENQEIPRLKFSEDEKKFLKKLFKFLIIADLFIITFYFLYSRFLLTWMVEANLSPLISFINMLFSPNQNLYFYGDFSGFEDYYLYYPPAPPNYIGISIASILIGNSFPFTFMIFWTVILIIFLKSESGQKANLKKFRDLTIEDFLKAIFIAIEVYLMFWLLRELTLFDITGIYPFMLYFSNIFLTIFVFFYLNQISFKFFYKEFDRAGRLEYFRMVFLTLLLYAPFIAPLVIFNFYYNNLIVILGLILTAFLNPLLKHKGFNLLTITIIDYFLILHYISIF